MWKCCSILRFKGSVQVCSLAILANNIIMNLDWKQQWGGRYDEAIPDMTALWNNCQLPVFPTDWWCRGHHNGPVLFPCFHHQPVFSSPPDNTSFFCFLFVHIHSCFWQWLCPRCRLNFKGTVFNPKSNIQWKAQLTLVTLPTVINHHEPFAYLWHDLLAQPKATCTQFSPRWGWWGSTSWSELQKCADHADQSVLI